MFRFLLLMHRYWWNARCSSLEQETQRSVSPVQPKQTFWPNMHQRLDLASPLCLCSITNYSRRHKDVITAQHLTRGTASRNWKVSCCGSIVLLPMLPFAIPHHSHMYRSSRHYQENQSGYNMYESNTNWFDHLQKTVRTVGVQVQNWATNWICLHYSINRDLSSSRYHPPTFI